VTGHALITGHAGFLGRHFTAELRSRGWKTTGVDVNVGDLAAAADDGFAGDCRDYFAAYPRRYNLIVHCAAVVGGREKIDGSPLDLAVNFAIDEAMFRYAVRTGAGRVLYVSSAAVYPVGLQNNPPYRLLREAQADWRFPGAPDQVYGWTKLVGEMLAAKARDAGVAVTVIRPFSGYGADQDDAYPFPAMIGRARRGEDPFLIWGDGRQVRHWIHVDDLVGAALALCDAEAAGPANLAEGKPVEMHALAERICGHAGYFPVLATDRRKPSGVRYRAADTTVMRHYYQPQVTIGDGIARALEP
jgi:nucleoside-diphosphate-sugar epimerase